MHGVIRAKFAEVDEILVAVIISHQVRKSVDIALKRRVKFCVL